MEQARPSASARIVHLSGQPVRISAMLQGTAVNHPAHAKVPYGKNNDNARLMGIFQDNVSKPVPKCNSSGFCRSEDDGSGGDNWSYGVQGSRQIINTNIPTPKFSHARCHWCHLTNSIRAVTLLVSHSSDMPPQAHHPCFDQ